MINFRTGTHNPLTLYVASEPYNQVTGGRELPGWMRDGEWSIGWLPHEGLAALAVEAWNGFVCQACPWGCPSCSLNRATCECYEHQDNIDEDGRPVEGSTPIASPAPAAEPVPVPPPVDALLELVDQLHTWSDTYAPSWAPRGDLSALRQRLDDGLKTLHAAGVEEGRRQLDAEIHASVFTSARLAAAGAGFGPVPESVTVTYDATLDPVASAFANGVAEGRRQATEERTGGKDA